MSLQMKLMLLLILSGTVMTPVILMQTSGGQNLTVQDIMKWPTEPYDHRIAYGSDPLQFGELRLPKDKGPHPVAVIIHGGCWLAQYNIDHIGRLCAALTRAGVATWSLEYRRLGDAGGGWPGTFADIARGTDHLRELAKTYPLDLDRIIVMGHSAGGHLALWVAARHRLAKKSPLYSPDPLPVHGVVSLAGITDLRGYRQRCGDAAGNLLGGSEAEIVERYKYASPIELIPLGVPQRLIHGSRDQIVPLDQANPYQAAARKRGDDVQVIIVEGAAHFEVIDPQSSAWPTIEKTVRSLLKVEKPKNRS